MEVKLITQEDYDRLMELLIGIDKKVSQIVYAATQMSGEWLDSAEASKFLHVTPRCLQNYRDKGMIPFSQIGRKILYKRSDIDEFIKEYYVKGRSS